MLNCIGIRNETKMKTERRAPLTPEQVRLLIQQYNIRVVVEPSDRRVFPNQEYLDAGAEISDDLTPCNIIFGIKEVPVQDLNSNQAYCFFSHTIKGQPYNMAMLQSILDCHISLFDYELVKNEQGRRTIFFGNFAGYAGMIDTLWALGERLRSEGIRSPFDSIQPAHQYDSLAAAETAIKAVGDEIRVSGLPAAITPLICGFCGNGQVSRGAQRIFQLLPVTTVNPDQLPELVADRNRRHATLYMAVFEEQHMVIRKDGGEFNLQEYYQQPEYYQNNFEQYLPYLNVIVNGIYWEPRYPRFISRQILREIFATEGQQPALRVIGDITCDIDGSLASTVKSTDSDNPVYVYDPHNHLAIDGVKGIGPVVMAVDILPAELPREASDFFGKCLIPHLQELAGCDYRQDFAKLQLSRDFREALIAHQGQLTPDFLYLKEYLAKPEDDLMT